MWPQAPPKSVPSIVGLSFAWGELCTMCTCRVKGVYTLAVSADYPLMWELGATESFDVATHSAQTMPSSMA